MLELIWKLSPVFVGEEHWKARRYKRIYHGVFSRITREHPFWKYLVPVSLPFVFSRAVCAPPATYTRSLFFLLVPVHIRREGNPGDSAWLYFFPRRLRVTAMLIWYLCDTLCHITLRYFNSRVKWFNCDKWMTVQSIQMAVIIVSRRLTNISINFRFAHIGVSKERVYTAI